MLAQAVLNTKTTFQRPFERNWIDKKSTTLKVFLLGIRWNSQIVNQVYEGKLIFLLKIRKKVKLCRVYSSLSA